MKKMYLLLLATLVVSGNLFAQLYGQTFGQSGLVDIEFANNGILTDSYSNTANMTGHTSVLQPNGKIIMAGGNGSNTVTLMRYTANGQADNSFGTNGKVDITAAAGSLLGGSTASLAVQADGKILYASNGSGKIVIVRLNVNGTLDNTFGTNGISYSPSVPSWTSTVGKVIVKADGSILTGGTGYYNTTNPYFQVARFLPNGKLDSSFASNGFFYYSAGAGGAGNSIALLPNDHIIIAGIKFPLGVMTGVNLKPNGVVDSSFGTNGVISCKAFLNDKALFCRVALQNDNKVLLLGGGVWSGNRKAIGLGRFFTNGKPDTAFAYLGTLTTTFEGFADYPQSVAEQFDGTLVISGYSTLSSNKFGMMRLKSNGTTDTTYGRLGKVLTAIPGNAGTIENSFMQPDGKLVLTGSTKLNNVYSFIAGRFVVTPNPHYNTLKGYCFLDVNHNGVYNVGEPLLNNISYTTIKPGYDSIKTYSSTGQFMIDVLDTGTYISNVVIPASMPYVSGIAPVNHLTSNNTFFNTDSVAFYVNLLPGVVDASIRISTGWIARVGTTHEYYLICKNKGLTFIDSATVTFQHDTLVAFQSAIPAPRSVIDNKLTFRIGSLLPGQTDTVLVKLAIPTTLTLHNYLHFSATITPDSTDIYYQDNVDTYEQIIGNSWDPNDKSEKHNGKITAAQVANGDYLTYTIRFQNTGNLDAINIFIRDTMSSKLDWNTLEMLGATHNYQLTMNDGKCMWAFNNIHLADSNTNEPESHGQLTYRVKPKPNVQIGDVVKNTAHIYFDYNPAVVTNTETTTVVSDALPLKLLSFTARKENKTNLLQWTTAQEINVAHFEVERSNNSREFGKIGTVTAGNSSYSFTDNNPLKAANYYRLKMIDKDGKFTNSPVRMISNNSSYFVSIYPNPAKDNLQVQIESDKKATLLLLVLSTDGKMLLSKSIAANEGSSLQSINISALPKGNYYLKVSTNNAGIEEQVIKFEKL